ncbi:hypothetical protein ACK280_26220 [Mycobacterium sherrisii]|uniref:hypothetical protein n=1 Tax=Mycobacterium sherrisii TaxID=243061 RepID=UPI0039761E04
MSGVPDRLLDASAARALTDRIKVGVEAVWELITQAYVERAWDALGYSSWDDYCTREFGTARLRLPREERAEVVASLRESGLSIRAIASATGDSYGTVQAELSGDQFRSPGPDIDEPIVVEQELPPLPENYMNAPGGVTDQTPGLTDRVTEAIAKAHAAQQQRITGVDGKNYSSTKPHAAKQPKRKPITDAFWVAYYDARKKIERLARLAEDDRFCRNGEELARRNLADLQRARQQLDEVIAALQNWWEK